VLRVADRGMSSLLTADQVAADLGVSKDWVYAEVRAGRIPHVRLGRNVRFRAAAIDEWICRIESGTMSSTTKTAARGES
jgi:excisionase family DNA binding protein